MKTLAELFQHTLKDVYYAENAIAKALPKVSSAVKNAAFKKSLDEHLAETKGQIKTLEKVFKSIGVKAEGEKCDAMDGLLKETDGVLAEARGVALDAGHRLPARPWNTMKSPVMVLCANGQRFLEMNRLMFS